MKRKVAMKQWRSKYGMVRSLIAPFCSFYSSVRAVEVANGCAVGQVLARQTHRNQGGG